MVGPTQSDTPITMVIMSANVLVRIGVQALLKAQAYIQLVGEAKSVHDVEDLIARKKPHVVMLEAEGDPNVLDSVHKLKALAPSMKIILLSRMEMAPAAWQALSSGIDGIVLTVQPSAALLATIEYLYHDRQDRYLENEVNRVRR
jgi:DNA-binding NarL/FixJ family response regulator